MVFILKSRLEIGKEVWLTNRTALWPVWYAILVRHPGQPLVYFNYLNPFWYIETTLTRFDSRNQLFPIDFQRPAAWSTTEKPLCGIFLVATIICVFLEQLRFWKLGSNLSIWLPFWILPQRSKFQAFSNSRTQLISVKLEFVAAGSQLPVFTSICIDMHSSIVFVIWK